MRIASRAAPTDDLRVRRSRAALTDAFSELALERGFRGIAPSEVAERANVGRSTLYSHFAGIDDLLAQSLDRHLGTLADCAIKPTVEPGLLLVITHFWEHRRTAQQILRDDAGVAVARLLARHLEAALLGLRRSRGSRSLLPASLVAAQLAAGQLALLEEWLSGRASASPDQVSQLLHATTYAAALASLQAGGS